MRQHIRDLEWIDDATVTRRWPDRIVITVTEQVAAAVWDGRGLLNTRGELFVESARHTPAELPRLSGPPERAADVAARYIGIREELIPLGLPFTGSLSVVVANIITANAKTIEYVDLRYSNGFTIGWDSARTPVNGDEEGDPAMLAARGNR